MNHSLKLSVSFFILFFQLVAFSQTHITCNANQTIYDKISSDPVFKAKWDSIQNIQDQHVIDYLNNGSASRATIYIPVVYHILHQGGEENISNEQILSDLEQMNNMFNRQNPSWTNVNNNFSPADIDIQFLLAQKKDDGTCFSGITRTNSSLTNHNGNSTGVANAVKAAHGDFPGDKYMNIFVCKNIGGAAGYTTQPWNTGMNNGIYILHTYVGTQGTSNFTVENATSAHEVGHWLNLDHLWGPTNNPNQASNCSYDDGIGDTPNTIGWTSCNPSGSSCSSLDNTENIMEYSYCPNHMFSAGQKAEMRSAATSFIGGRNNVTSASNLTATGVFADVLCEADFKPEKSVVCEGEPVQFFDNSYHNATSWSWSFPGGTPSTSTAQNPIVTYNTPGPYNVSLTATNASGSRSITKQGITILGYWGYLPPFSHGFEAPNDIPKYFLPSGSAPNSWTITSAASYTGTSSAYVNNFNNNQGALAELSSETINLSNFSSASLNFQYAYAKQTSTLGESVQLLVSTDCGETWVVLRGLQTTASPTNSSFIPSGNSDWDYLSVNIPGAFLQPNFRFQIRITNNGGNNLYIDDISFSGVASLEEEVNAISDLKIFPNPANSETNISLSLKEDANVEIHLLDMLGKTIKTISTPQNLSKNSTHSFNIKKGNLNNGVYFVKFTINNQVKLQRVIFN